MRILRYRQTDGQKDGAGYRGPAGRQGGSNKTVGSEVGMHGRKVAYLKHVYLLVFQITFFSVRSAFCEKLVRF